MNCCLSGTADICSRVTINFGLVEIKDQKTFRDKEVSVRTGLAKLTCLQYLHVQVLVWERHGKNFQNHNMERRCNLKAVQH